MNAHNRLVHEYESGIGVPASGVIDSPDPGSNLAATLPVWTLAAGSVAAVAAAANRMRDAHGLAPVSHRIDPERITAAFSSDHLLRVDGKQVQSWADLSGFFPTFDGWVRTHANYPHHRSRLLTALGLPEDIPFDIAVAQIAMSRASDIEDNAAAAGAVAVQVRTEEEWAATPQAADAAAGPLVSMEQREDRAGTRPRSEATPFQPLRGVRVLDMTRVIAGPVATRTLALLGAEVLRIDPPWLPELPWQFADTCQGKHSVLMDMRGHAVAFHDLLSQADVLVTGYRPGALESAGLITAVRRGLIHARISAWGESGPWSGRRGFDSIVQAATGIAVLEGAPQMPGSLPAQAIDHSTGYLLAAGIIDALAAHTYDGVGRDVRASLARTASWLLSAPGRTLKHPPPAVPNLNAVVAHGNLHTAAPALAEYPDYAWPAPQIGSGTPAWPVRTR
ncbi:CoA transferase [Nocardia higoensis]|uniref:CoA transferase n=1 Tax=Nocardia higoensis TaxID=228599 RepID=A0ABS0D4Z9_9NOCA|nr:CoA transferase [Nocardia higoensis]MBF6353411.1 CoA transferase [Nocardia higoensis]